MDSDARQFTAFHVREDGQENYFQVERAMDILTAAQYLRNYLRGEVGMDRPSFAECYERHQQITAGEFDRLTELHMANSQNDSGVFELDFDKREFSEARPIGGWRTFPMEAASRAAYHAFRPDNITWMKRISRFAEKLAGTMIASAGHLSAVQVSFAEEISEIESRLNFYMETNFDVDAMFGTHVCTDENDDCLNVYADYDMAAGQVCDELEVDLHRADGREESVPYTLNAVEKAVLLWKMDEYCQRQTGMTLKDYSAMLMAEDQGAHEEADAVRPISVFRVTQDGRTDHLLTEGGAAMDAFHTALRLRAYLGEKNITAQRFAQVLPAADYIAPEVFRTTQMSWGRAPGRSPPRWTSTWTGVSFVSWPERTAGRPTRSAMCPWPRGMSFRAAA